VEIPRHWRLKDQRYGLVGDVCEEGHPAFPPDDVCKICDPDKARVIAIAKSIIKSKKEIADTEAKIVIYEANPNAYESLDDIKYT
jgi:hypothetical protein